MLAGGSVSNQAHTRKHPAQHTAQAQFSRQLINHTTDQSQQSALHPPCPAAAARPPPTLTGYCCGQCSRNQLLTSGTSTARLVRPLRWLKGAGAHMSAMPLAVVSL